jgi:DnaJ-class molecular chaperone
MSIKKMNYEVACDILGIDSNKEYNMEDLKRIYRQNALVYHPDKNLDTDTTHVFHNIQNAYEFLLIELGYADSDDGFELNDEESMDSFQDSISSKINSYSNILYSFMKPIMQSETFKEIQSKLIYTIIEKLTQKCENQAFAILEKIDKKVVLKIYELLNKYKSSLHISEDFLRRLEDFISQNLQNDECFILNPFLEDLFENNIYKLIVNEKKYLIPLWHHELIYDNSGSDLYVRCVPILPDHVDIDENNNIHINRRISLNELWLKGFLEITLGKLIINVPKEQFKLMDHQVILLANMGISKINSRDIYDVSKKGDIYLHLDILTSE